MIKANCIQYDSDGNKKFEINPTSKYLRSDVAFIYSLPNGGLLALIGNCEKRYCDLDDIQFLVEKIDSTGKIIGTLNISDMKFESGIKGIRIVTSVHIDNDNNYCLSLANYRSAESHANIDGTIEASTRCFTDGDFSD